MWYNEYIQQLWKEGENVSNTLLKEIRNIAVCVLILGIVQIIVVLPTRFFGSAAIFGTLLGCAVSVFNFALMGFILEKSITRGKQASGFMGLGYIVRLTIIALAVVWAIKVDYFNYVCVIIPIMAFSQISIFIINHLRKRKENVEK